MFSQLIIQLHLSQGTTQSWWDLMTFKSINLVLKHGIVKQLDFEDLLSLPTDMEPSTCHDRLLSCWQDQQSSSDPVLIKAIYFAYGWPYFCIGLLKVSLLNSSLDSIPSMIIFNVKNYPFHLSKTNIICTFLLSLFEVVPHSL